MHQEKARNLDALLRNIIRTNYDLAVVLAHPADSSSGGAGDVTTGDSAGDADSCGLGAGEVTAGDSGGVDTGEMAAGDGLASAAVASKRWHILTHVVSTPASMIAPVIKPRVTNAR